MNQKGDLATRVSTDEVVRRANELQRELGEGPCLDVMRDQDTLVSCDLSQEQRWPLWAAAVQQQFGVDSMMSVLVFTDAHSYGALSLYAGPGQRFDDDDVAIAQALAGNIALVLTSEREIDHLGRAMHGRTLIGQAQGVLMERLDIDAAQAFDYLRRISSHSNRKVTDVAQEIVRTRELPASVGPDR